MTKIDSHVFFMEASPMVLLPATWKISHKCRTGYNRVTTGELLAHAQKHDAIKAHEILEKGDTID